MQKLGHNPSLSALKVLQDIDYQSCRIFLCPKKCTKNAPTPFLSTSAGVFRIPVIPYCLSHFLTLISSTKYDVHFFLLFPVKKCTKKGNHLCSSLLNLKMTFHQHSSFLISNCEIWSHCFKILVPSV